MNFYSFSLYTLLFLLGVSSCMMEVSEDPMPDAKLDMESFIVPDGFNYEMYTSQQVNIAFADASARQTSSETMQYAIIGSNDLGNYHNMQSGYLHLADGLDITINRPLHIQELMLYTKYDGNAQFHTLNNSPLNMTVEDLIVSDELFTNTNSRIGSIPNCTSFLGNATKISCKNNEVVIKSSASFLSVDIEFSDGIIISYTPDEIGVINANANQWAFSGNIGNYSLGQASSFTVYADCRTSPQEVGTSLVTFSNPCEDLQVDSDNDGIIDDYDIAPDDADVASATYLPAYEKFATFAFEDSWPYKGDYDFNDLVVSHTASVFTNSDQYVTKVKYDLIVRAIGARFDNDLSISFTDPQHSMIIESIVPQSISYDIMAVDDLSELRFKRIRELFSTADFINTDTTMQYLEPVQISLVMLFDSSIQLDQFKIDEYLRINQEVGRELHKPGHQFTSLIDLSLLGDGDDDTSPALDKYYKTTDNLPWVLEIPVEWEYPKENIEITKAYPKFKDFAQGHSNSPWYTDTDGNKVHKHLYKKKR